jgi:Putative adhesin
MQTFSTPAPITATLDIPAGRVQFIASDRTDTTVEVLPADASKNRDVKLAEDTTVDYRDGDLRIAATTKNQYFGASGSIQVTVHLPAGSHLRAKTSASELRTTGRLGEVTFDGAYRHITIDEAATIHLTATDGDVEIGHLHGPAQISTARGDIRVTEATAGTVVLSTQLGNISIGAAAGVSAALDARTVSGRVHNALKNDGTTQLDIRATTTQGDITARSL